MARTIEMVTSRIYLRRMTVLLAFSFGIFVMPSSRADAHVPHETLGAMAAMTVTELSAQSRRIYRRAPSRVRIYRGSSYPGPNAVRICNAHYVQEYRPSGTVIVPRMRCYWRG